MKIFQRKFVALRRLTTHGTVGRFLADIIFDVKDFSFSLVKPFVDFVADAIDAHKIWRYKNTTKHIEKNILSAWKPYVHEHTSSFEKSAIRKYLYGFPLMNKRRFDWSGVQRPLLKIWMTFLQQSVKLNISSTSKIALGARAALSFLQQPIVAPAVIIGIPLVIFGVYKICRKRMRSFCVSLFCITTIIGRQLRGDSIFLWNHLTSALRVLQKKLPDKLSLPTLQMPSFNAKKYFAHFIILPRVRMPVFSFRMPRIELPRLHVQWHIKKNIHFAFQRFTNALATPISIRLPVFSAPQITMPSLALPRFSMPHLSFPRRRESSFTYIPFKEMISLFSEIKLIRITFPLLKFPHFTVPRCAFPALSLPYWKNHLLHWIPAFEEMTHCLRRLSPFSWGPLLNNYYFQFSHRESSASHLPQSSKNNFGHFFKHRLPRKLSHWKKYYALEIVILLIFFGTIGVFMSIYADTTSNRANMPIVYQGRLMDASYVPKSDSTYYLAFEIYTASSGGTCKWRTETTQDGSCAGSDLTALSATTSRGLFTVMLGAGASDNPTFGFNFDATASYLQVYVCPSATPGTVAGPPCETLTPRKQIGGVTYAYNADLLDGLNYDGFLQLAPTTNAQTLTFTGTTTNTLSITASSITSGSALILTGPSSSTGITGSFVSSTSYIGASGKLLNLIPTFASSSGGSSYGIYLNPINSNTSSANTTYGIYATSTDAVALGNTNYGIYNAITNTGALAAATKTLYGDYISVSGTGASTSATTNVYGSYITTTATHSTDSGTINNYGLYIADGTSSTNGTSTKYGLYIAEPTGADTNYGAIIAGGFVGINVGAPTERVHINAGNATNTLRYSLKVANAGAGDDGANIATGILFSISSSANDNRGKGGLIYNHPTGGTWNRGDFHFLQNTVADSATAALADSVVTIKNSGVVIIGPATSTAYGRLGQLFEINTSANYGGLAVNTWSATAAQGGIIDFNRSNSATIGTHTIVASGDALGRIHFRGSDGVAFQDGAAIHAEVDGTTSANDMPGRLIFATTPDGSGNLSERMRITSTGTMLISDGTTVALDADVTAVSGTSPGLVILRDNNSHWNQVLVGSGANAIGPSLAFFKTRSTAMDANTVVVDGDDLMSIIARGSDGGAYVAAAQIRMEVDGTPGSSDMPGRITFSTTPDGSNDIVERMRIDNAGKVGIGMTPSASLDVTQATVGNQIFGLTSTATIDDPNYKVYQGRVATTDDTITTINTIALTASNTYIIEARIIGRTASGAGAGCSADNGAGYVVRGTYKQVGGTASLIGSVNADYTAESDSTWAATLNVSSGNVLVQVTGSVATCNITWHSTVFVSNVGS